MTFAAAADSPIIPGPSQSETSVNPALPNIPAREFQIASYGARGDGVADNTAAIQAAITAAEKAQGGTVVVSGGIFLSGPLRLGSQIALKIATGATLRMLPLKAYPGGVKSPGDFIGGAGLHDIAITGGGTIDGQGEPWWPYAKKESARRPRMIALSSCERLLIEQVTLMNAPMFHIAISGKSSQVTVRGVTIRAPASTDPKTPSHNTDACDVSGNHILIEDCDVSVGDDNFTCGGNTANVLIRHCTYGYGHGVSIGSYTRGGVSNITVTDCTFTHTDCGIRIKSDRDRGGVVQNLLYQNLKMTDVGFPILIYAAYLAPLREYRDLTHLTAEIATRYPAKAMGQQTPQFRDITFRHITASTRPGARAGLIWGLPEAPVRNVLLQDVTIKADLPFGIYNAEAIRWQNSAIATPDGLNRLSVGNAQVTTEAGPGDRGR